MSKDREWTVEELRRLIEQVEGVIKMLESNATIKMTAEELREHESKFGVMSAAIGDFVIRRRDDPAERERILSYFAWMIGGWNASPGVHPRRLAGEPEYEDNEKIARLLLTAHASTIKAPLLAEIQRLKAELYDK
jgi:hypothetical protein